MSAHEYLVAQKSGHTGLGEHSSAHTSAYTSFGAYKSAHTSARKCTFLPRAPNLCFLYAELFISLIPIWTLKDNRPCIFTPVQSNTNT